MYYAYKFHIIYLIKKILLYMNYFLFLKTLLDFSWKHTWYMITWYDMPNIATFQSIHQ